MTADRLSLGDRVALVAQQGRTGEVVAVRMAAALVRWDDRKNRKWVPLVRLTRKAKQ